MRAVRILFTLIIGAGTAGATSLAVIRTAQEIVIAADSRVTSLSSEDSMPDMCKVRQTGNAIAAFVGLVSYSTGRPATSFDAVGSARLPVDRWVGLQERIEECAPESEETMRFWEWDRIRRRCGRAIVPPTCAARTQE